MDKKNKQDCLDMLDAFGAAISPGKDISPEYISAKAEFQKSDGTVYTATWHIGATHCTCQGFKFRRTCRHVKALASALETKVSESSGKTKSVKMPRGLKNER